MHQAAGLTEPVFHRCLSERQLAMQEECVDMTLQVRLLVCSRLKTFLVLNIVLPCISFVVPCIEGVDVKPMACTFKSRQT